MDKHIDPRTGKPKIILDLCGGTGAWSRPYKLAGYDVRLITLPEHNVCTYAPPKNVYGILAAPPCTMFSLARTTASTPRDFDSGIEVVAACLNIVWRCRKADKLKFWVLENPLGLLRQFLGRPVFSFEQWEFGDTGIKPTDLWGYFDLPCKTVFARPEGLTRRNPSGSVNANGWSKCLPGLTKADVRAITPEGFASAFYKANK